MTRNRQETAMGRVIQIDDYRREPESTVLDGLVPEVDEDGLVTFHPREAE